MAAEIPRDGQQSELLLRTLLMLTTVTGIVDAVSYLVLGRVFVANMTGNVVFLGFAISGDKSLSIAASLVALAAFMAGAVISGRVSLKLAQHRGRHLAAGTTLTMVFVALALLATAFASRPLHDVPRYGAIVLLALGMGVQNATVRRLAVADATTTVLTQTITGLASDSVLAGGHSVRVGRRIGSVLTMFSGALIGGLLVHYLDLRPALALALVLLGVASYVIGSRAAKTPASEWEAAG